jgi:hypothetical protein
MHRYLLYLLLFCHLIFLFSCDKDKLKAPQSSFLVVDPVTLTTTPSQGSNSHKITDIWYYVDGQFKGIFPVGNVMPIISSGNAEITLFAGIKNNGISATRAPYSLYNSVTIHQDVEPGKTYTVSPNFEYNSGAFFYYCDNFDLGSGTTGSYFTPVGDSFYVYTADPAKTFGGIGKSVYMSMSDSKRSAEMLQSIPYFLPSGGATIYLELNYKCNQPFTVGVIGTGSSAPERRTALTVNKSDDWNKIYVSLTSVVSMQPTFPSYQVFIHADKRVTSPEIYIDNVKLIYQ